MAGTLQPLVNNQKIIHPDGTPTDYFIRWAQQRQIDIGAGITAEQAQQLIDDWAAQRSIIAGTGLSGGGTLAADRTINLADTVVTPGTYGDATHVGKFTVDQQGRITDASSVAISGGGGGGAGYAYTVTPNTLVSSSAFATKGRTIVPLLNMNISYVVFGFTPVVGASYRVTIAEMSGTTIAAVIATSAFTGASTTNQNYAISISAALSAGLTYGIMLTRTDLTGTYVLPMNSASATSSNWGGVPTNAPITGFTYASINPIAGGIVNAFNASPFTGDLVFSL